MVSLSNHQGLSLSHPLLESYKRAVERGELERYRKRRWQRAGEYAAWLAEPALSLLTMDQARSIYRAAGGARSRQFQTNPIEEIRDSLDFLLYDTITLEGRFQECASEQGGFRLAGAGKEFTSFLLCLRDPSLFAIWRPYVERALRALDMYPPTLKKGHLGLRYLDLLDALQEVKQLAGLSDYPEVDEFCYAVTRVNQTQSGSPA